MLALGETVCPLTRDQFTKNFTPVQFLVNAVCLRSHAVNHVKNDDRFNQN